MARQILCSSCGARLALKNPARAGRKFKCPSCGEVVATKTAGPRPDDGDEFAGSDESGIEFFGTARPRKRRKASKKQSASPMPRGVLIGGAGVAVAAAVTVFAIVVFRGEEESTPDDDVAKQPAQPTKVPAPTVADVNIDWSRLSRELTRAENVTPAAMKKNSPRVRVLVSRCREMLVRKQPNELSLLPTLDGIASWYRRRGRGSAEAEDCYRLALRIWNRNETRPATHTLFALRAGKFLGDILRNRAGKGSEAIALYKRGLRIIDEHKRKEPATPLKPTYEREFRHRLADLQQIAGVAIRKHQPPPPKQKPASPTALEPHAGRPPGKPAKPARVVDVERALHVRHERVPTFVDTPLKEAVAFIASAGRLPIRIDRRALANAGIAIDRPVNLTPRQKEITPAESLDLLTKAVKGLAWEVRFNVAFVTTRTVADGSLHTFVFHTIGKTDPRRLMASIQKAVPRPGWFAIDGTGGTFALHGTGTLIIRNSHPALREIERRFSKELKRVPLPPWSRDFRIAGGSLPGSLFDATGRLDFVDSTLPDALRRIAQTTRLKVSVDRTALAREGIRDRRCVVNGAFSRMPPVQVVCLMADACGLGWRLKPDGSVEITTRAAAQKAMVTATHHVDQPITKRQADALMMVAPGPWKRRSGVGGTIRLRGPNDLEITQSIRSQLEIARILSAFRKPISKTGAPKQGRR